jgi:hypothetical protein
MIMSTDHCVVVSSENLPHDDAGVMWTVQT